MALIFQVLGKRAGESGRRQLRQMRGERHRTVMLRGAHGDHVGPQRSTQFTEDTRKWCIEGTRLCRSQDVRSSAEKVSGRRRDTPCSPFPPSDGRPETELAQRLCQPFRRFWTLVLPASVIRQFSGARGPKRFQGCFNRGNRLRDVNQIAFGRSLLQRYAGCRLRRARWHPRSCLGELTPRIRPAKPALRSASPKGPADQPDADNRDRFACYTVRPTADAIIRS